MQELKEEIQTLCTGFLKRKKGGEKRRMWRDENFVVAFADSEIFVDG